MFPKADFHSSKKSLNRLSMVEVSTWEDLIITQPSSIPLASTSASAINDNRIAKRQKLGHGNSLGPEAASSMVTGGGAVGGMERFAAMNAEVDKGDWEDEIRWGLGGVDGMENVEEEEEEEEDWEEDGIESKQGEWL